MNGTGETMAIRLQRVRRSINRALANPAGAFMLATILAAIPLL